MFPEELRRSHARYDEALVSDSNHGWARVRVRRTTSPRNIRCGHGKKVSPVRSTSTVSLHRLLRPLNVVPRPYGESGSSIVVGDRDTARRRACTAGRSPVMSSTDRTRRSLHRLKKPSADQQALTDGTKGRALLDADDARNMSSLRKFIRIRNNSTH